ncbi:MAG: AAA family ATPase, partial [Cyclobacteriaceae bacterium]|nr:AAA family ATPase [Cyclobacteriaceae bacterium]
MKDLVATLHTLYTKNIIHGNLNPDNILISDAGKPVLIDFGISVSSALEEERESQVLMPPDDSLFYVSPEQTGRTSLVPDHRSDYYSLGVTLYELLAGKLPFNSEDPVQLIHSHITQIPVGFENIKDSYTKNLENIILKLLKKNPEERYQSARGLLYDLNKLETETSDFQLARGDYRPWLSMTDQLYGREKEWTMIKESVEKCKMGEFRHLFVSGTSGSGKSSLVNQIKLYRHDLKINFAEGKFEQLERNTPLYAWANAFREVGELLLTEEESMLKEHAEKVNQAIYPNGKIITDLVPLFQTVIGKQETMVGLSTEENQNRYLSTLNKFIEVLSEIYPGLVFFIDDLQWADTASMDLLYKLVSDATTRQIYVIGAYRSEEVDEHHPLAILLGKLKKDKGMIDEIFLGDLSSENVSLFLKGCMATRTNPKTLADYVHDITRGNPLFIKEFLQYLFREGLLRIDHDHSTSDNTIWEWDINSMYRHGFKGSILELLDKGMNRLSKKGANVLNRAAIIGNNFDLKTLSFLSRKEPGEVYEGLREAMKGNLIVQLNGVNGVSKKGLRDFDTYNPSFVFCHDQFQQSAYLGISKKSREKMHFHLMKLFVKKEDPSEQHYFQTANHIVEARKLILEKELRIESINILMRSGEKALSSTSYVLALNYFECALNFFPSREKDIVDDQFTDIAIKKAYAEYLCRNFRRAEEELKALLQRQIENSKKAEIFDILNKIYQTEGKWEEALQAGIKGLSFLGYEFSLDNATELGTRLYKKVLEFTEKRDIDTLINLPVMEDANSILVMKLLENMGSPCYVAAPALFPSLIYRAILLSLEKGNT